MYVCIGGGVLCADGKTVKKKKRFKIKKLPTRLGPTPAPKRVLLIHTYLFTVLFWPRTCGGCKRIRPRPSSRGARVVQILGRYGGGDEEDEERKKKKTKHFYVDILP